MSELNTVTYHFENGSKQVSNIGNAVLFDEKKRKRSKEQIDKIFSDTCHDIGAISYGY